MSQISDFKNEFSDLSWDSIENITGLIRNTLNKWDKAENRQVALACLLDGARLKIKKMGKKERKLLSRKRAGRKPGFRFDKTVESTDIQNESGSKSSVIEEPKESNIVPVCNKVPEPVVKVIEPKAIVMPAKPVVPRTEPIVTEISPLEKAEQGIADKNKMIIPLKMLTKNRQAPTYQLVLSHVNDIKAKLNQLKEYGESGVQAAANLMSGRVGDNIRWFDELS